MLFRSRELVRHADVVVDGSPPDWFGRLGIDVDALLRERPGLVRVAITPFGLRGPRAKWKGSDLVCAAAAGMVFVNGFPEDPPLAPFGLQAYHATGVFAAIGAMLALLRRARTGAGGSIDLSVQAATAAAVEHVGGFYRQNGAVETRRGTLHWSRSFRIAGTRDGDLLQCILGDWTTLVEWVASEGDPGRLREPRYEEVDPRKADCEAMTSVTIPRIVSVIARVLTSRLHHLRVQPQATDKAEEEQHDRRVRHVLREGELRLEYV